MQEAYNVLKNSHLLGLLNETSLKEIIDECTMMHWRKAYTIDSDI